MQKRSHEHLLALLLCGSLLPSACKSADEHRRDADEEVYRLVLDRRAGLAADAGEFTIEPTPDSLRQRLLRGDQGALGPLSIADCLEIAAENSREYQERKERLYLVALDLTIERWEFSVKENGTLATFLRRTPLEGRFVTAGGGFSLTRLLGSGALIVGDIGLNLVHNLTDPDGWNPISNIGLAFTQPLMRGSGERIVMEPLTQAERDLVYEVRAFERFRRTFAFDVANLYYLRLLQSEDAVGNQERNYENLTRLSSRNEELSLAGRLDDLEFGQARQNELRSRFNLLEARERLDEQRDALKLLLGLPIETVLPLDPGALAALAAEDLPELHLDEERAIDFALKNRLDHLTALDQVDDGARKVVVAADGLRADLDLVAAGQFVSVEDKPFKLGGSGDLTLGVAADLALDRLPERNLYRATIIAHVAAQRDAERSGDTIVAQLRDELREAATTREGHAIQTVAVEVAEQRIESTRMKLEAGRADTRDLLEAEEALLQAQNAATQALIDYTLARLALFRDMELLRVDEEGIAVDDTLLEAVQAEANP